MNDNTPEDKKLKKVINKLFDLEIEFSSLKGKAKFKLLTLYLKAFHELALMTLEDETKHAENIGLLGNVIAVCKLIEIITKRNYEPHDTECPDCNSATRH